jgi:predicted RNA-binding Zn-ribbon protein involved in translation (DUF1610 family)
MNKDGSQNLFSDEEMNNIIPGAMQFLQEQSVTCLGKEFPNDEARRAYFREELRKKLPELRKIEGFPIGEDEDIINLSDPPYYTACPNPWLNDFIAEWEKEKEQLEKEGKRKADFDVKEPYASDVSEGKNNPIYMAHAYHTKCPHPAIMRYILHYTQPGDIVFDGFAGTGMTSVAANLCGSKADVEALKEKDAKVGVRHSICSDLSPIATLIAASYTLPFNAKDFECKANAILDQVEKELGWMYETEIKGKKAKVNYTIWSDVFTCPSCGKEIVLWDESVNLEKEIIRDKFPCPHCGFECSKKNMEKVWESSYDSIVGDVVKMNKKVPVRVNYTLGKRNEKDISDFDTNLINSIDYIKDKDYPTYKLIDGFNTSQPIRSNGIIYSHQFFTKRNLIFLYRIYELVIENNIPLTWLTSTLQRTTKCYKFTLDRKFGILTGTLYIPSLNVELNPVNILRRKIGDFASVAYNERGNSAVSLLSATALGTIDNNSVDYMFVDPPFGANIMYSELSSIWEGWLKVATNNQKEAIVNEYQHKTLFDYQKLMNDSLREFYRILKPGKWLTMEFSNTSASVWNSIQNALQGVGFVVANVAALDKKQGSFKAVTTTTAVKQDLVISCYKPSDELTNKISLSLGNKNNVWDFISEHLSHLPVHLERGNVTTTVIERSPKILYDRMISYYVQHGYPIPMDAQEFQKGLKEQFVERDGMYFTETQAAEYMEKRKHTTGYQPLGLIVSDEANGIEWLKIQLKEPKTYQEISPEWMQTIKGVKKGDVLPELIDILQDNFIKDENGKWHVPDLEKQIDLQKLRHNKLMREFNIIKEQAQKPRARIKEVHTEAVREGFKQCFKDKDFATILLVGDKIPQHILTEDEVLLQYYDIAQMRS